MRFWGWIPHLYPNFELKFEPRLFADTIIGLNGVSVRANDDDPEEESKIEVEPIGDFSYGMETIRMSITIGDNHVSSLVTVYSSGMICFDLTSEWNVLITRLNEDKIRYAVREIYFSMKKLFHDDIHHKTDPLGSSCMKYADDNFAIVKASDIKEAVMDIFSMIVRKCENTLSVYPNKGNPIDTFDSTVYSLISGFMSYGRNFLNVNRDILGDDYKVCLESLMSCERSLEGKDREMRNLTAKESDAKSQEITQNTAKINERLFWLTMLSIAVGFFAGSLLADSIDELTNTGKLIIVIIVGVAVAYSAYRIYHVGNITTKAQTK